MFERIDHTRAAWWVAAGVLALALLYVLYSFVGTFVLGLFLYYSARPVYVRLRERLQYPSLAATVSLLVLALPALLLFSYTVGLAINEIQAVTGQDIENYAEMLGPYFGIADAAGQFQGQLQEITSDPVAFLTGGNTAEIVLSLLGPAAGYLNAVLTGLVHFFLMIALAYYLLKDDDELAAWSQRTFTNQTFDSFGRAVDRDLQTVYFGNILTAFLTGTVGAVVFWTLSMIAPQSVPLPLPILFGLLTGVGSLVPVVGMKIVYIPVALYLTVVSLVTDPSNLWFPITYFVVTFLVVDSIPDLVLRPYVSGRNLHVGSLMFAYILGTLLFGWYGIFLGPLLLVVFVNFATVVVPDLFDRESV